MQQMLCLPAGGTAKTGGVHGVTTHADAEKTLQIAGLTEPKQQEPTLLLAAIEPVPSPFMDPMAPSPTIAISAATHTKWA